MTSPIPAQAVRLATPSDIPEIVRITNLAYQVERSFLEGDRTHAAEVQELMTTGAFLVLEGGAGSLLGSVFIRPEDRRAYLGLLAVAPEVQRQGWSRLLLGAAEVHCREAGCQFLDLTVVNLRRDLFAFYARNGFAPYGTLPFPRPAKVVRPCRLIQFTKALVELAEL